MTVPETLAAYRACGYRLRLSQNGKVLVSPERSVGLNAFLQDNYNEVVHLLEAEREHIERERLIALIAELGPDAPQPAPSEPPASAARPKAKANADEYDGPYTLPILVG